MPSGNNRKENPSHQWVSWCQLDCRMQVKGNSHKVTILAKVNRYIGIPCYDHPDTWNNWQLTTYRGISDFFVHSSECSRWCYGWHKRYLLISFPCPSPSPFSSAYTLGAFPGDLTAKQAQAGQRDLKILRVWNSEVCIIDIFSFIAHLSIFPLTVQSSLIF